MVTEYTYQGFKKVFDRLASGFEPGKVLDDFLTLSICTLSQDITTGRSRYEDEYMTVIKSYTEQGKARLVAELFAYMSHLMDRLVRSGADSDILGKLYEEEISKGKGGLYFTPYPVGQMMAMMTGIVDETEPKRILDPACGSGRLLIAARNTSKVSTHTFFGMDINPSCVKMAAINLFLHGMKGEVLWCNSLDDDDFRGGYRTGHRLATNEFGIIKIEEPGQSMAFRIKTENPEKANDLEFSPHKPEKPGNQLKLF
jgi:type I restriction-modification system DNA methylase subunit